MGDALRQGMGRFATGVTLVTTRDGAGRPAGTTANAVSSLSLDPPLLLVCLARTSLTLRALRGHGHFAVNVLAATHADAARRFARRGSAGAWETVEHRTGRTGSPRVEGALTVVDCALAHELPGGDHVIVVGRVLDVETGPGPDDPLLYFRGAFASLPDAEPEPPDPLPDCDLPTLHGAFRAIGEATGRDGGHVVALVHGDPGARGTPLVRTHTACLFGDALGSLLCDCRARLDTALSAIVAAGAGVLLYAKPAAPALALCAGQPPLDDAVSDTLLRRVLAQNA